MKKKEKQTKQLNKKDSKLFKSKIIRFFIFLVGLISFALGTVGIVLPILPTTPLYLLAGFCFVRSNERFNKWFLNSNLYKKHMENFATTRSMIYRNEVILLASVSAMLIVTMILVNKLAVTIILTILIACKYGYFIFQVKPISRVEFNNMQTERKLRELVKEEISEVEKDAR